jgi:hypothetical protein
MRTTHGAKGRALIYVTLPSSGSYFPVITDPLFYLLAIPAVTCSASARAALPGSA